MAKKRTTPKSPKPIVDKSGEVSSFGRVGRRELAALMGISPDTVSDYLARGMPAIDRGGRGREARFDLKACLAWHREQLATPITSDWRAVSREQLAELLGVHPDTVSDYARRGMPVASPGGHGKESAYDAIACSEWHRAQTGISANEIARTRVANVSADLKELQLKFERGQFMERDQVVREVQTFGTGLRAMILALPRRAVQAGAIDPPQETALADVCLEILTEISQWQSTATIQKAVEEADAA